MATERFKEWVASTKSIVTHAEDAPDRSQHFYSFSMKAIVYALLTVAIAIHEAAETKRGK